MGAVDRFSRLFGISSESGVPLNEQISAALKIGNVDLESDIGKKLVRLCAIYHGSLRTQTPPCESAFAGITPQQIGETHARTAMDEAFKEAGKTALGNQIARIIEQSTPRGFSL